MLVLSSALVVQQKRRRAATATTTASRLSKPTYIVSVVDDLPGKDPRQRQHACRWARSTTPAQPALHKVRKTRLWSGLGAALCSASPDRVLPQQVAWKAEAAVRVTLSDHV